MDNVGVAQYTINRNGVDVAVVDGSVTSFVDRSTRPSTTYSYAIRGIDVAGNASATSAAATISTPDCTCSSLAARPSSDVGGAGFIPATGTARYAQLDEPTPDNDATYIQGPTSGTATATVGLAPVASGTTYRVTVRYAARQYVTAGKAGTMNVHAELWDGTTLIGTGATRNLGTSYDTFQDVFAVELTDPTLRIKVVQETAGTSKRTSRFTWIAATVEHDPLDTTAPTSPSSLRVDLACSDRIRLSWVSATDSRGVQGYRLLRNGAEAIGAVVGQPAPVHRFDFSSGSDGFVESGNVIGAANGGVLRGTADGPGSWHQAWTWTGSWESLGVPTGATVASVRLLGMDIRADVQVTSDGELHVGQVVAMDGDGNSYGALFPGRFLSNGVYPSTDVGPRSPVSVDAAAQDALQLRLSSGVSARDVYSTWYIDNVELEIAWTGGISPVAFTDIGLAAATTYTYTVLAVDAAGNSSTPTAPIAASTIGEAGTAAPDADCDGVPDELEALLGTSGGNGDTDDDGLTDEFEAFKAFVAHSPTLADTDGDGVPDGTEDFDGDGLTALDEQARGTSPLEADPDVDGLDDPAELDIHHTDPNDADTDDDGLNDGAEIQLGTDPLNSDSDGDGTPDGSDQLTTSIEGPAGVIVEIHGTGDLSEAVTVVDRSADIGQFPAAGQKGAPYEFTLDDSSGAAMSFAEITLPYDPSDPTFGDPSDLAVFYLDETTGAWIPAADSVVVDQTAHTVTVTVNHFSVFALFNLAEWVSFWQAAACETDPEPGEVHWVDVALVIDSSGSMLSNDPANLRLDAAKDFVDLLSPPVSGQGGDRGAVVDFDEDAVLLQGLTTDRVALQTAIDAIDSSGGTSLTAGMQVALDELTRVPAEADRQRVVIMLTDGVGSYSTTLTQRAIAEAVIVFTIGLGSGVNQSLLNSIATDTGGRYFPASSADELEAIFQDIGGEIDADLDDDGLTDCQEIDGLRRYDGVMFTSDPAVPDTDGDGLLDGDEMYKASFTIGELELAFDAVAADPRQVDSDSDGLIDGEELELDLFSAFDPDKDGDGLTDAEELFDGLDPARVDTDGDGHDDFYEVAHAADGFDPRFFDEHQSPTDWADDFAAGAFKGDWDQRDSIAWLLGILASSAVPGLGGPADVRDAVANAVQGNVVGVVFCVVGLVPVIGDLGRSIDKISTFIGRFPSKADAFFAAVSRADFIPRELKIQIIRAFRSGAWDTLAAKGVSDDDILKLTAGRHGLDGLARLVDELPEANVIRNVGWFPGGLNGGRQAETFLADRLRGIAPAVDAGKYKIPDIPGFERRPRFPDVRTWDVPSPTAIDPPHLHEMKTGFVYNTRLLTQARKDVAAVAAGRAASVTWHFAPSDLSSSVGLSEDFLADLRSIGNAASPPVEINIVLYLP